MIVSKAHVLSLQDKVIRLVVLKKLLVFPRRTHMENTLHKMQGGSEDALRSKETRREVSFHAQGSKATLLGGGHRLKVIILLQASGCAVQRWKVPGNVLSLQMKPKGVCH